MGRVIKTYMHPIVVYAPVGTPDVQIQQQAHPAEWVYAFRVLSRYDDLEIDRLRRSLPENLSGCRLGEGEGSLEISGDDHLLVFTFEGGVPFVDGTLGQPLTLVHAWAASELLRTMAEAHFLRNSMKSLFPSPPPADSEQLSMRRAPLSPREARVLKRVLGPDVY